MAHSDNVRALKSAANQYCDPIAWPTVALVLFTVPAFFALPLLTAAGLLPVWLGFLAMAFVVYATYTPLHEAVHGAVCGAGNQYRWLNEAVGYASAAPIGLTFTGHRHERFLHHAHTNNVQDDPDHVCAAMSEGPWRGFLGALTLLWHQYSVFVRDRWGRSEFADQQRRFVMETAAILCIRVLLLVGMIYLGTQMGGYSLAGSIALALLMLVGAYLLGAVSLIYLFAYIVHHPHDTQGKFVDTSVFVLPTALRTVGTWLWGFQNYHGIHHAFPRVPWYRYRALYEQQEAGLRAEAMPVYDLQGPRWVR